MYLYFAWSMFVHLYLCDSATLREIDLTAQRRKGAKLSRMKKNVAESTGLSMVKIEKIRKSIE